MENVIVTLLRNRKTGKLLAKTDPIKYDIKRYEKIDTHTFKLLTAKEIEEAQKIYQENERLKKDNEELLKQLRNK